MIAFSEHLAGIGECRSEREPLLGSMRLGTYSAAKDRSATDDSREVQMRKQNKPNSGTTVNPPATQPQMEPKDGNSSGRVVATKLTVEEKQIYVDLAKMYDESVKSRRENEWKLAFGFWTAIGVFTAFIVHEGVIFPPELLDKLGIAYAVLSV